MRRYLVSLTVVATLTLPASVTAQAGPPSPSAAGPEVSVALGLVSSQRVLPGYEGVHAAVTVRQALSSRLALRGEGILADGEVRGLAGIGSAEIGLTDHWYAVVGTGVYFDNGTNTTWAAGLGSDLSLGEHRIGMEVRYLSMNDGGLYWSIRKPLW